MRERAEAMKAIWTEDEATYHGRYVNFDAITSWPKPVQKPHPPLWIGGAGEKVIDRVLRYGDGWFPNTRERLGERIAELRRRGEEAGRGRIPVTHSACRSTPAGRAARRGRSRPGAVHAAVRGTGRGGAGGRRSGRARGPLPLSAGGVRRMDGSEARRRFAAARVARLATAGADGRPHVVPVVFAVAGDTVYTAVDDVKPKTTTRLRRLANIAANPAVALLADHYEDDWSALWWVRADGTARLLEPADEEAGRARALLVARYRQYREAPPPGVAIAVDVGRWSGWAAAATP